MSNSRQKRLDKAQINVLFNVPFFAPGVAKLPVEFLPEVEYRVKTGLPDNQAATACTDGERLLWCGEWFDSLPDQVLVTLLCHEVGHCLLGHIWRLPPPGGDAGIANEAADHAINLMLKEFSATVTAKRLADPFPFPTDYPGLADPQFSGMAEEVIYAKLASMRPPQGGQGKPSSGAGKAQGSRGVSRQGSGNQKPSNGNVGANPGGQNTQFGQFQPKAVSGPKAKALKSDWEGTLIQSVAAMKGRGDLPMDLERLVDRLVSPSVDWWNVLRSWLREQCSDDWTWLQPAMEWSGSGFLMPSLKSEKMGPVVFGSDWSGSTMEFIGLIHAEKQHCLDQMRPSMLLDLGFDTEVQWAREYAPGDTIDSKVNCGGGTDFRAVWREIEKREMSPKCVVMVTDGDGEFGDDPGYPIIWVSWVKGMTAPFGQVIYCGKD